MKDNKHIDGKIIAQQNEELMLYWLFRFGGLSTRELTAILWPDAKDLQMSQRTIRRLLAKNFVLKRPIFTGGNIYVISEGGARYLRKCGYSNISSRGHRDLNFNKPTHRIISNNFLINWHQEISKNNPEHSFWTEFEIQRRVAPFPLIKISNKEKIPDGIIQVGNWINWIEVENSYKGPHEIQRLMETADHFFNRNTPFYFHHKDKEYKVDGLDFVLPDQKTFRRIANALIKHNLNTNTLKKVHLYLIDISPSLVWNRILGIYDGLSVAEKLRS